MTGVEQRKCLFAACEELVEEVERTAGEFGQQQLVAGLEELVEGGEGEVFH